MLDAVALCGFTCSRTSGGARADTGLNPHTALYAGLTFVLERAQVQLDIRQGHAQTVDKVLAWLDEEGGVAGTSVCDCGCGTGSLAIPLALRVRPP